MYLHSKLDKLHEFSEFGALVGLKTGLLQIEPSLAHLQKERKREGRRGRKGGTTSGGGTAAGTVLWEQPGVLARAAKPV